MRFWDKLSLKLRILVIIFSFLLTVLSLDQLIFGILVHKFPNLMEWDTSPWYNFLNKTKKITQKSLDNKKIFFTGSSVTLYSANPNTIKNHLIAKGNWNNPEVDLYSHVAMSPTDFRYYLDDILSKQPDVIVYPIVVSDFQLDSFYDSTQIVKFDNDKWFRSYLKRDPVLIFYPFEFLKQHFLDLKKEEINLLFTKSILYINRLRNFILDPFYLYYEKVIRKGRSYHNYTGVIPNTGIWWKGWTTNQFEIECEIQNNQFSEYIFFPYPKTKLLIKYKETILYDQTIEKAGWELIKFSLLSSESKNTLIFAVDKEVSSKTIDPKSYAVEQKYGIRLSQNFCKNKIEEDISYTRIYSNEDKNLETMTDDEYKNDYHQRLWADIDSRRELARISVLRSIKKELINQKFQPWIELENLNYASSRIAKTNTKLILVLVPENPLESKELEKSEWMKDFIGYLTDLTNYKNIYFYDRMDFITKMQLFIDINHFTYNGAEIMSEEFSNIILEHVR
jgi:hypothetical protein